VILITSLGLLIGFRVRHRVYMGFRVGMLKSFFLKVDYIARYPAPLWRWRKTLQAELDGVAVSTAGSKFPAVVGLPDASVLPRPVVHLFLLLHWAGHCARLVAWLSSVDQFHYKLLSWSWLIRHWRTDWLLWRSALICCLIMPTLQAGVRLSVSGFPACLQLKSFSEAMNIE